MEKIKLLVIDDDKKFSWILRDYAEEQKDIQIVGTVPDGISGLDMIKVKKPDVVILDNVVPKLDGIGVLNHLQNFPEAERPKVVMVTACPTQTVMSNAYHLGVSYIMSKDTDINEIVDRCRLIIQHTNINITSNKLRIEDIETEATNWIVKIGVPASLTGYNLLRTAISKVTKEPELIERITKKLYPSLAKEYHSTSSRVERAIRHAIEVAFDRGDTETLNKIFGFTINQSKGKPTNSEFIAMIADKIRLEMKKSS